MNWKALTLYGLTVALWVPALLSVYFSEFLNFWDLYQAVFMVMDLLAFIPLSLLIVMLAKNNVSLSTYSFTLSGIWWIIMAVPDWLQGNLADDYKEIWFADVSILVFMINLALFSLILIPKKNPTVLTSQTSTSRIRQIFLDILNRIN